MILGFNIVVVAALFERWMNLYQFHAVEVSVYLQSVGILALESQECRDL